MIKRKFGIVSIVGLLCLIGEAKGQFTFGVESGALFTGYNNVRIPGNIGTFISLGNELEDKPSVFIRLTASYTLNKRHSFHVLYAPLSKSYTGITNNETAFQGLTFPSNAETTVFYKFNSYRASYRYAFMATDKTNLGLGITAKMRDANIRFKSNGISANKANVGFVPLVNFHFSHQLTHKTSVLMEGDALAAKHGRAEDVLVAGIYKFSNAVALAFGYRFLEGGADNDEVYTFSLFRYAVLGISFYL